LKVVSMRILALLPPWASWAVACIPSSPGMRTSIKMTSFDPERIAERYWEVVHADGPWQAEFRFTGE
jgi:hypothetical protein